MPPPLDLSDAALRAFLVLEVRQFAFEEDEEENRHNDTDQKIGFVEVGIAGVGLARRGQQEVTANDRTQNPSRCRWCFGPD